MKKPANLIDKALEVARKERGVPKKPVKTKGKKTVPEALDWGPGIPLDKLAYLNDDEMALVQAKRMFKGKRKYKGIPAFPDPGDTAAGDRGQGTSSSSGLGGNTTGGGSTYGGGGGSDSGAGGAGGMGSYNGSTEGSRQGGGGGSGTSAAIGSGSTEGSRQGGGGGSTAAAASGSASSSGTSSGSSSTSGASDQSRSSGPSRGPTSDPSRTETSYSNTTTAAPSSFGSFSSNQSYDPVSTTPSSMASEATMDRIASGSSVIGNTTPEGYSVPKIQDRVPSSVTYTPPTSTPPVDTTGANSPFADPEVGQYDADRPSLAGAVGQYSQYRSPPSPTTSAYTNAQNQMYTAEDAANFGEDGALPRGGGYARVMDPTPTSYDPTPSQYAQSDMAGTTRAYGDLAGPNQGLGYNPTAPGTYAGNTAVASAQTPAAQATTNLGTEKTITDRVPVADATKPYGDRLVTINGTTYSVSPQQMAGLTPAEQQAIATANQAVEYNPAGVSQQLQSSYNPLSSVTPPAQTGALVSSATPSATRGLSAPVAPSTTTNVFYSSPAEQAADIRRAVALAQGPAAQVTPASVASEGAVENYNYDPSMDPSDYVAPIYPGDENQPGYMTNEQRMAYLNSLGGTRSSEYMTPFGREEDVRKMLEGNQEETDPEVEEEKPPKKEPVRNPNRGQLKKEYLYTDYNKNIGRPDREIAAFNAFNKRFFKKGGRVGDSVEAALRIAKSKLL